MEFLIVIAIVGAAAGGAAYLTKKGAKQ